ncbi:Ncr1 [Phodopus roborovskii]|uniref:Natural cytotoxicity triggering receptor 1 n=1 Tax=Phodopus roborovskii TaxID=109678 RepID=A0AAU9YTA3_PHORO|nr:Ncr1 [Phodopus roborovskii]
MLSILAALLCMELCLSQRINTGKQTLPKPIIWAKPSSRVTKGTPVNIWCQGPQSASAYQLYFEGSFLSKAKFFIPQMTSNTAGRYYCFYQSGELLSEHSELLVLVVTGMYDTPNLSVHPGPDVTLGENVTFSCLLEGGTSKFFLLKEGEPNHVQQGHGNKKAEFPMGPMTRAHRGTYRCFGSYNHHAWSFPSEPVTLLIPGDEGNTGLVSTDPTSSLVYWEDNLPTKESGLQKGSALWDHTTQNLIRIGLACIVLTALICLLAEDWLSRKRDKEGNNRSASWECRRRLSLQCSLEEEQKDAISMGGLKAIPGPGAI